MSDSQIILSESELKYLIKTTIQQILREELQRYVITEMVYPLSIYKEKADNMLPQIAQNWCLVRYVTLSGEKQEIQNHWRKELIAHLSNIGQMKLKDGDKVTKKQNALFFLWNRRDFDTDENCIHMTIAYKFDEENLPIEGEIYAQVIQDFKNSTKDIIDTILSSSYDTIVKYVNSI